MGEEPSISLTGVVLSAGDTNEVEILLSGDVASSSVSAFHLENPSRVVVDIVGVSLGDVASEVAGEAGALVRKVELTDFAEDGAAIVRASIHLGEAATHELQVEPGTIRVALSVGESTDSLLAALGATSESGKTLDGSKGRAEGPGTPSGPKKIDGLSLSSLDFGNHAIGGLRVQPARAQPGGSGHSWSQSAPVTSARARHFALCVTGSHGSCLCHAKWSACRRQPSS